MREPGTVILVQPALKGAKAPAFKRKEQPDGHNLTLPRSQLAPLVYYISRPNTHEFTRLRVGKDSLIIQQLCQQVV